ncbi:MAG: hypothetical protein EHM28_14635 [Spirochaetaceae bacterium]|nr:MAG: hypothetical protein EHM28_14635 [Spirochaetaceae bacterium]
MGRIAADNISGRPVQFTGSIGTTMFKVFDISVARTGLGEVDVKRLAIDSESVVVTGLDRTHYYSGADYIVLKLVADRKTKRILGASGYGRGDLVSRIEVLAAAIQQKMSLHDIFLIDLGYFPAFNNPIDILQTAANVLENKIDGIVRTIRLDCYLENSGSYTTIDVSPAAEHSFGRIPGSINLPLENLRAMSLPYAKDMQIVLYSRTSSRAYEAWRYLSAQGFSACLVLEGGYEFYGS